jgi:phi LC3 family holin
MKINWKVRLRNKTWVASLLALVVTFVYNMLAAFDVVPAVTEEWVMGIISTVLTLLTALGVLIDPTTQGVADSDRAMMYVEPGKLPDEE